MANKRNRRRQSVTESFSSDGNPGRAQTAPSPTRDINKSIHATSSNPFNTGKADIQITSLPTPILTARPEYLVHPHEKMARSKPSPQKDDPQKKAVRIAPPQPMIPTTIEKLFGPLIRKDEWESDEHFQSITFKEPFKPFSFEELRLADYDKLNKSEMSSGKFFGQLTTPTSPKSGTKQMAEKSIKSLPASSPSDKTASDAPIPQSLPSFSIQSSKTDGTKKLEESWAWVPQHSLTFQTAKPAKNEKGEQTFVIGSLPSSGTKAESNASRAFFGLSASPILTQPDATKSKTIGNRPVPFSSFDNNIAVDTRTTQSIPQSGSPASGTEENICTSSLKPSKSLSSESNNGVKTDEFNWFSALPSSDWNVKDTKTKPLLTPSHPTTRNNPSSSWFPDVTQSKQDRLGAQETSLLSSLPKTPAVTNFTLRTAQEQLSGSQESLNKDSVCSAHSETHAKSGSASHQKVANAQKDVSTTTTPAKPGVSGKRAKISPSLFKPQIQPAAAFSTSTMGNELSTDQPSHRATMTEQTQFSGYKDPFDSISTMAANLLGSSSVPEQPKPAPPAFKFDNVPSPISFTPGRRTPAFGLTKSISGERQKYLSLHHTKDNKTSGADEQLRTTPLLSLSVKEASEARNTKMSSMFPQYAFLGCRIPDDASSEDEDEGHHLEPEPVLLNTNTPWSAFICGSQGSGKSYSLSAIIENCLHASLKIGKLPRPLAGVVFHNNTASANNICEAAHLVSLGIKVNVLVSRSNYHALSSIYKKAVSPKAAHLLNIQPLILQSHHLTAERMHRLMAFQESETAVPLYMEVIMRILREMAITGLPFSYSTFKAHLENEGLTPGQKVMMEMRLCLLESFMDPSCIRPTRSSTKNPDIFSTAPGTLTIVDLSDPFLDSSTTCTLFDILLSLFLSSRPEAGVLICLDEAHKFMKNTPAAETFTENLLTVIREQRHNACRVVIATQEPTISPKLLDLCSITMVHRFTSPDWLATLRGHLAGASDLVTSSDGNNDNNKKIGAARLFEKIINLDVGESLLFSPSAVLEEEEEEEGKVKKLGTKFVKFKTRVRLGEDGGKSVLAVRDS